MGTKRPVTGQIIHDLLLVELFDVKYYRDVEMWVRDHSRSLKVVPFERLGTVSYSPFIVTMTVSAAILEIFSVKEWPETVPCNALLLYKECCTCRPILFKLRRK